MPQSESIWTGSLSSGSLIGVVVVVVVTITVVVVVEVSFLSVR
jgi:hypothetical protein